MNIDQELLEAIPLLVCQHKGRSVRVNENTIQFAGYFLGRKMQRELGYLSNYYCTWSDPLHEVFFRQYENGYAQLLPPRNIKKEITCRTELDITPEGLEYMKTLDERKLQFYWFKLQPILNSLLFRNRDKLYIAVILDKLIIQHGKTDQVLLMHLLRILGWYPSNEEFKATLEGLRRMRLPYEKRVAKLG